MRSTALAAALLTVAGGGALTGVSAAPAASTYELLSVNSRERPSNSGTRDATVSRTGRYVAFTSDGSNLSQDDRPGKIEAVFVRDRRSGVTRLGSRDSDGNPASGISATISDNGRFLAFCSLDPDIVAPDTFTILTRDSDVDVFVRDLRTGVTRRASTDRHGKEADDSSCSPRVADNGDTVFESLATDLVKRKDTDQGNDFFLWDWSTQRVRWIAAAYGASISADASVVAFVDFRAWVDGDDNGHSDAYLLLRTQGRYRLVTHQAGGGPLQRGCDGVEDVSADGRFVLVSCQDGAMASPAVPDAVSLLYLIDTKRGTTTLINPSTAEYPKAMAAAVSDDGRTVAFAGPIGSYGGLPGDDDAVYVWRRGHGLSNLTPGIDDSWTDWALDLSADGRLVVFTSAGRTLSDQDPEDGTLQPQIDLFGVTAALTVRPRSGPPPTLEAG